MRRVLSLLLALATVVSLASFVSVTAAAAFVPGEPVTLPNLSTETVPSEGFEAWSGNVSFDSAAKAVTFVFRVTGVQTPIVATKVNPTLILEDGSTWQWSTSADQWQWNNIWGGIFAPEMVIPEDGVYYLYLNQKVLVNNRTIAIAGVKAFNLFNKQGNVRSDAAANANDGATFQMLDIVPNDLSVSVEFYNGTELLTVQSYSYTSVGNNSAGDTVTGITDGVNNKNAKRIGALITPDDLFAQQDQVPLPDKVKVEGGKIYRRVWLDESGNIVDGVYRSGKLTLGYAAADTTVVDVTFIGTDGKKIYSRTLNKNELAFDGDDPTKAADADYTYTFAGWSLDGENVVDLSNYQVAGDVLELIFYPVFKRDLILKAELVGEDEIAMGGSATYQIKLNRTDVTVDALSGVTEPINSGRVVITYPADAFSAPGQIVSGATASVTTRFTSVSAQGVVGQLELTAADGFAGAVTLLLSCDAGSATTAATTRQVTVTGQLPGSYISDPATVKIAQTNGTTAPAKQLLWSGSVPFDGADAVSFVYKMEGVQTSINAYQMNIGYNGSDTQYSQLKVWNESDTWSGAPSPRYHTFTGNGYYVLYLNSRLVDDVPFTNVSSLSIFASSTTYPANNGKDVPENTNENATFTMLAVVGGALTPTVTFHDAQGDVIGQPYTHRYVDEDSFSMVGGVYNKGSEMKQTVALLTPAQIFAATGYDAPAKATDDCYSYTFAGWADANGDPIDAVYMNMDVYPVYDKTAVDPVKVHFTNGDATLASVDFPRAGHIEYTGAIPTKADTADHSYLFRGWTTDKAKTLATSAAQAKEYAVDLGAKTVKELLSAGGELTLYAVFEQTDRMWDIRFHAENGDQISALRVLGGQLVDPNGGQAAAAPRTPEKAEDASYTYTPNGWADADGKQIIDRDGKLVVTVTGDVDVYPAYERKANRSTVTFLDDNKWTELGKSTVDHGAAAQAPEDPTKESTQYYSYKFTGWVDEAGNAADLSSITADITVYASYEATYINPFVDVKDGSYYSDATEYAVVNGVMNGTDSTHFSPDSTATRGQMVTVLWRLEGEPTVEGVENPFTDLGTETAYYYKAVLWAYSNGLVNGVSATEFKPNNQITREQFVAILYRYAKEIKGYYMGYGNASYENYPDKDAVQSYAADAFRWAIATAENLQTVSVESSLRYNKVPYITGVSRPDGKTYLAPAGEATRAQMVTMLYRFLSSDHVDAPPVTVSDIMAVAPSVYAVGDEYQICVLVKKECTMWVEVGGKSYYDHSNGILRSSKDVHVVRVPQEALDAAEGYTVHLREIIDRKPYYTVCGGVESVKYNFRPVREKDEYHIINLADSHGLADAAIASGSYFGDDLDLLIMNGDIIDSSSSISAFKTIYRISGGITKGEVPCIYSRGNHELRGLGAEHLADYTPTDNGKSYYTFRLGPIWGIVLDAGEDKADSHAEYGNTVACEAFREEEEAFLNEVIASEEWQGASVRLVISHVPLAIKMSAPYDVDQARYAEWTRKIAMIEPTLWLSGHLHSCFLEEPGDRKNTHGYPCPQLCSSYKDSTNNRHTSGAVILTEDEITARYVTEMGEIAGEKTIARLR